MIALDVMGGDFAPDAILHGALLAARDGIPLLLCGPRDVIEQKLDQYDSAWRSYQVQILHAQDVIGMSDEPVRAVRSKPLSSLVQAVRAVKDGLCDVVISAGSSGALMAAAHLILGKKEGVERPAIAGILPAVSGDVLVLDLGASTDCRAAHLEQFAYLGATFMEQWLGKSNPRVALLANGHEEGKGDAAVKEVYPLLKAGKLNFIGNIEPDMVVRYGADVVVCDGFAGNIFLKTFEATSHLFDMWINEFVATSHHSNVQSPSFAQWGHELARSLEKRLTFKHLGGAMLLGVNGLVVVCHGNSSAKVMHNALRFAHGASIKRVIEVKTCPEVSV